MREMINPFTAMAFIVLFALGLGVSSVNLWDRLIKIVLATVFLVYLNLRILGVNRVSRLELDSFTGWTLRIGSGWLLLKMWLFGVG
ncbi:MAG: hypothetical protein VX768_03350 [Planctomycetota bacterium]|nr:hypothetical protein [Planctomycetota bacterium]